MATSTITTCDFVRAPTTDAHGVPATKRFQAFVDGRSCVADLCDECLLEMERALHQLGVRPGDAIVDGKHRGAYVTASGRAFTTAEAREWLIGRGFDVKTAGRIKDELMAEFAKTH